MPIGFPSRGVIVCCSVLVGVISLPSLKVWTTRRTRAGKGVFERRFLVDGFGSRVNVVGASTRVFRPATGKSPPHPLHVSFSLCIEADHVREAHGRDGLNGALRRGAHEVRIGVHFGPRIHLGELAAHLSHRIAPRGAVCLPIP